MALLTIMHAILAAFLVLEFIPFGLAELSVSRAPCMHLLNAHDSLFSVAQFYDSDWLTVWSLNQQLPQPKDLNWGVGDSLGMPAALSEDSTFDPDGGSLSEYVRYAKPYVIQAGETLSEIAVRFGTTVEKIQADSEGKHPYRPRTIAHLFQAACLMLRMWQGGPSYALCRGGGKCYMLRMIGNAFTMLLCGKISFELVAFCIFFKATVQFGSFFAFFLLSFLLLCPCVCPHFSVVFSHTSTRYRDTLRFSAHSYHSIQTSVVFSPKLKQPLFLGYTYVSGF